MIRFSLTAIMALGLMNSSSNAAITFGLELAETSYTVDVGQSIMTDVFFVERGEPGDTLSLGTGSTTIRFNLLTDVPGSNSAQLSSAALSPEFLGVFASVDAIPNGFDMWAFSLGNQNLILAQDERRFKLGTVEISGLAPGTTAIGFADSTALGDFGVTLDGENTQLNDGFVLSNSVGATVTTVPEPASFLACGLAVAGLGARRYRRRKSS